MASPSTRTAGRRFTIRARARRGATGRRRAVAAAANRDVWGRFISSLAVCVLAPSVALGADSASTLSDTEVLGTSSTTLHLESVTTRVTAYNQFGAGYQSKSGPILGPGSERLTVFEPQTEIVATQGDRITHRLWVPVDVITEASPASIPKVADVVSGASRHNVAGALQWTTAYKASLASTVTMTSGIHLESPFRSWNSGLGASNAVADQSTVL